MVCSVEHLLLDAIERLPSTPQFRRATAHDAPRAALCAYLQCACCSVLQHMLQHSVVCAAPLRNRRRLLRQSLCFLFFVRCGLLPGRPRHIHSDHGDPNTYTVGNGGHHHQTSVWHSRASTHLHIGEHLNIWPLAAARALVGVPRHCVVVHLLHAHVHHHGHHARAHHHIAHGRHPVRHTLHCLKWHLRHHHIVERLHMHSTHTGPTHSLLHVRHISVAVYVTHLVIVGVPVHASSRESLVIHRHLLEVWSQFLLAVRKVAACRILAATRFVPVETDAGLIVAVLRVALRSRHHGHCVHSRHHRAHSEHSIHTGHRLLLHDNLLLPPIVVPA
mmetsp:Transcript_64879/g.105054  ORF Transcript_64879/g.105054 Transcript_64879/m.105054 type:complete len:332 (+) Transcript_64879:256-1251(+)